MQLAFKNFQDQLDYWFACFGRMKAENMIEIALTGKRDIQLFTDICKSYIDAGNMDFDFTEDYKYFRRRNNF